MSAPVLSTSPTLKRRRWFIPALLLAATLAAFGGAATAEFSSWDDPYNVFQNPRLNPPTLHSIAPYWNPLTPVYGLYIPFTYSVWGLLALGARVQPDSQGVSLNPWVFHAANIGVHLLSVLIVFKLLESVVRDRRAACVGALLFGLHPVQVEPVAWVAGLKDVLAGMFALLAIWQYVLFAQKQAQQQRRPIWRRLHYGIGTLALTLAMLSKPSAMMAPVMALAIDYWLVRRPARAVLAGLVPWLAISLACAIETRYAQPAYGITPAPLWARPLIAGDSLAFYLYKLAWPIDLAIDYGRRPEAIIHQSWIALSWVVPVALAVLLWINRRRYPEVLVAGIIFVAGIAPVCGIVTFLYQHFSTTADHYLYLSMLGPGLACAWALARFGRTPLWITSGCILALLGVRTIFQIQYWRNDFALFEHALRVNPDSFAAMNNLGHAYNTAESGAPERQKAQELFERAIELYPDYWEARENLASLLKARGDLDQAIAQREQALRIYAARPPQLRGNVVPYLNSIALDLMDAGRLARAAQYLQTAQALGHDDPETVRNLKLLEEKEATTHPAK